MSSIPANQHKEGRIVPLHDVNKVWNHYTVVSVRIYEVLINNGIFLFLTYRKVNIIYRWSNPVLVILIRVFIVKLNDMA